MSFDWSRLAQWKLLKGSHTFPGPDGGTCANEAAIVAAGFPYRAVNSAKDLPPCFSRMIGTFIIHLNDEWDDEQRQALLPFVFRLAGTADDVVVEARRLARAYALLAPSGRIAGADFTHRQHLLAAGTRAMLQGEVHRFMQGSWSREVASKLAQQPVRALEALEQMLALGRGAPLAEDVALERLDTARATPAPAAKGKPKKTKAKELV